MITTKLVYGKKKPELIGVGNSYSGVKKWLHAALINDEIYCTPSHFNDVLQINIANETTSLYGANAGTYVFKWLNGTTSGTTVCSFPHHHNAVMFINSSGLVELITIPTTLASPAFYSTVYANGYYYGIPRSNRYIWKINESTKELTQVGADLGSEIDKYRHSVYDGQRYIYLIPETGKTKILQFDTVTDTHQEIGGDYVGNNKWQEGVLADNGHIYVAASNNPYFLKIDTTNFTTSLIGNSFGSSTVKYIALKKASNGLLYGFPRNAEKIVVIDPNNDSVSEIDHLFDPGGKFNNTMYYDGKVYGIPCDNSHLVSLNIQTGVIKKLGSELIGIDKFKASLIHDGWLYLIPFSYATVLKIKL